MTGSELGGDSAVFRNLVGSPVNLYRLRLAARARSWGRKFFRRTMSPLVQRSRNGSAQKPDPTDQHWSMLLFESLSAGVVAVTVGLGAVLVVVGVYVSLVWPLTFWDLDGLGLEQVASWTDTVLWSVFAGGSLAGYWCFSGAAFKSKPKARVAVRTSRTRG
jgi:hypothetical protein